MIELSSVRTETLERVVLQHQVEQFLFFTGATYLGGKLNRTPEKMKPFECGSESSGGNHLKLSVKFYLIGMLFILFDIEVIFLVPWAAVFKTLAAQGDAMRWFIYLEMMVFVGLLLAGYIYVVKKGAFDWGERARREAEAEAKALHEFEARQARQQQRPAA